MHDFGDGNLVFSASDLANASECLWAQVRRIDRALGFAIEVPKDEDSMLVRAGALGNAHEARKLAEFKSQFQGGVAEIARPDYKHPTKSVAEQMRDLSAQTLQALADKKKVVFQATFFDGVFQGFADFLELTDTGEYAVSDTKLARKAKITALIQLAAYAHQLQKNNVPTSKHVHLILGDQSISTHELADIMPTYLKRRAEMLALIESRRANKFNEGKPIAWNDDTYAACGRCVVCEPHVEEHDDLLSVAGMRLDQRAKLRAAGIDTATKLAETNLARVKNMSEQTFINLRRQACVQRKTKQLPKGSAPVFEVTDAGALAALPMKNPGDIFFDFEGDPLYQEGEKWNLDYLFGYVDENSVFVPIWAHNLAEEKAALIQFTDMLKARLAANLGMHVYHYAAYEKTHLLSLAARHGVAEDFIDDLLRKSILVDLYPIVRRAVIVGSHSYSLKKLEPIFCIEDVRTGVANAADSVVEYANYCELVANNKADEAKEKLNDIEKYNAYDCRSTLALREWLVGLACEKDVKLIGAGNLDVSIDSDDQTDPLFVQLMARIGGVDVADRRPDQTAIALAAAAIDFHRREKKSFWWAHFDRLVAPVEDWQDTRDVFIVHSAELDRDWHKEGKQRNERRHLKLFTTPAPGSKLSIGSQVYLLYPTSYTELPEPKSPGARRISNANVLKTLDDSTFIVEEMLPPSGVKHKKYPLAVTPGSPPATKKIEEAIKIWGEKLLKSLPDFERQPALDVLRKQAPLGGALPPVTGKDASKRITETLQIMTTGTLAVQGPPGAGKSFNGGRVIADLVIKYRWKIGVVSQGHATIENLLRSVSDAGLPRNLIGKAVKKEQTPEEVNALASTTWTSFKNTKYGEFMDMNKGSGFVVGGTVYEFVKTENFPHEVLDLLVIDEAGQFSLANTIAASTAAKRLLLLGDPQQLPQVTQGTHPAPIDGSALGWLADGHKVLPPEFGYFLPSSWRMNEQVCSVVSNNWYDSKLGSAAPVRKLEDSKPGVFPIAVGHQSNSTESPEEAEKVIEIVRDLLRKTWIDEKGCQMLLADAKENIIVVAPYNAQVQLIRAKLDSAGFSQIPVGTVDKFQGQQAAVAIVSMTASSAMDVPRGIEFLFMPNRLNVAISRAKWAAYLLYSPALLDYRPTNVDNLRLLSKFLNLVGV